MRIGTWNLDAKWSQRHEALLVGVRCDVWLLTEVNPNAHAAGMIAGYHCHLTTKVMAPRGQHWAAVLSLTPQTSPFDPHEASAAALVEGVTYCASVLPWRGCRAYLPTPWVGDSLEEMARPAIESLTTALPKSNTVWGGDWNQNLAGGDQGVGSCGMRRLIESAVSLLGLKVVTAELPFQNGVGPNTIDHIAVPLHWHVRPAVRIPVDRLSDHDAFDHDVNRVNSIRFDISRQIG